MPEPPPPPAADATDAGARVAAVLAELGVEHEIIPCDPELADTAAFCAHYGYPLERSANTILVASKKEPKQYAACVVTGVARLDVNKTVKRLLGAGRLSFAKPEETMAVTGMLLGGVTVLALPAGLPIYVDRPILDLPWVILGGGNRSTKVKVGPDVFRRLPGVEVVDGLSLPA